MFFRIYRNYHLILALLPFLAATGCAQLQAQRDQIAAQDQTIKKLRDENKGFQDAYYKIKDQLDSQGTQSQKSVEQLTRELGQARTQQAQKEKDLGARIQTLSTSFTLLRNGAQEEKLQLQTQIAKLQQDVQGLTTERNTALAQQKETADKLVAEQGRTAGLTQQVAQLTTSAQALSVQITGLKKNIAERDTALKTEQDARQAAEKRVADQVAQLAELNKNNQTAQAKLTEQGTKLAELDKNYQGAQAKLTEQGKQLQEAQATLTTQSNQLKEAQTQSRMMATRGDAFRTETDQLKKDKDTLAAELAAAKSKYDKDMSAAKALYGVIGTPTEDPDLKQQAEELKQRIKGITVKLDGRGLHLIVPNALLFEENKTILADRAAGVLEPIAQAINDLGDRPVQVAGHTDNQMVPELPYADLWGLGLARADRVREFLMKDGRVAGSRLTALSRAQFEPLASNDTPEGRKQNRRVEIIVGKK